MTNPDAASVRGRVNTRRMVGLTAAVVGGLAVRRSVFESTNYGVAPDGRFLMLREVEAAARNVQLQVVLGFADEVHRLVSEQQ